MKEEEERPERIWYLRSCTEAEGSRASLESEEGRKKKEDGGADLYYVIITFSFIFFSFIYFASLN